MLAKAKKIYYSEIMNINKTTYEFKSYKRLSVVAIILGVLLMSVWPLNKSYAGVSLAKS